VTSTSSQDHSLQSHVHTCGSDSSLCSTAQLLSQMARCSATTSSKSKQPAYQVPVPDIAHFDLGGAIALLTKIMPTCFWMVYHVHSDSQILHSCRDEVLNVTRCSLTSDGQKQRTVNVEDMESQCSTLLATMREVLRYRTVGTSARLVTEDQMLDNKYLLKKGGMFM
jgi:hypothetical protein